MSSKTIEISILVPAVFVKVIRLWRTCDWARTCEQTRSLMQYLLKCVFVSGQMRAVKGARPLGDTALRPECTPLHRAYILGKLMFVSHHNS